MIILSFIIGIILFYVTIIPSIHKLSAIPVSQKFTRRILSLPFWQIILCDLVCLYALQVEPVYKQTDEDVSSFVQEYSAIGDLVNEYTGINTTSNYNYLMSEAESLHTYTIVFMVIVVIFTLTAAIGSIGKKLNKRIVEGMSIIATLGCCWIAKSSTDLYEMIIRDGATLQAIAWIGSLLGTDIYLMMDLIIRSVWILPLILIIKHFYYHKALNEYYVWVIPQSRVIKQQEENEAQEQSSPQTAASSINPIEYSNAPTMGNNPELVIGDISNVNQQSKSPYIGLVIGGVVIIIIAVFVVWQCTKGEDNTMSTLQQAQQEEVNSTTGATQQHTQSTSDIYEQRSNTIIQELTSKYGDRIKIVGQYPDLSRYVAFMLNDSENTWKETLVICDVETGNQVTYDFPLRLSTGSDRCGTPIKVFDSLQKDKLLLIGENGGNEFADMAFLLEIDPLNWTVREINWGLKLEEFSDKIKIVRRFFTRWDEETGEQDWVDVDIYYNLQGRLIAPPYNGNSYQLKGLIDNKYAVTMQLSMQDNKIYGKYFYDKTGGDNYLYLYGGVSDSGDVVLLEFNNKGEQTSDFMGRFTNDSFYGTFTNYKQVKMPFELHLNNGTSKANSSQAISGNSKPIADNDVAEEDIPVYDSDPEFPGGMSNLRKYISENVEYPAISQENGIAGQVKVSYIINEDGSISDVEVIESVDPYLDKEAIRVISLMPKWNPGIRDGKFVKMKTSTYVKFSLH